MPTFPAGFEPRIICLRGKYTDHYTKGTKCSSQKTLRRLSDYQWQIGQTSKEVFQPLTIRKKINH